MYTPGPHAQNQHLRSPFQTPGKGVRITIYESLYQLCCLTTWTIIG